MRSSKLQKKIELEIKIKKQTATLQLNFYSSHDDDDSIAAGRFALSAAQVGYRQLIHSPEQTSCLIKLHLHLS